MRQIPSCQFSAKTNSRGFLRRRWGWSRHLWRCLCPFGRLPRTHSCFVLSGRRRFSTKREDDRDFSVEIHRLAIEQSRTVTPLLDGIHSSLCQLGWPGNVFEVMGRPILPNNRVKHNRAANMSLLGRFWVFGVDPVNEPRGLNIPAGLNSHDRRFWCLSRHLRCLCPCLRPRLGSLSRLPRIRLRSLVLREGAEYRKRHQRKRTQYNSRFHIKTPVDRLSSPHMAASIHEAFEPRVKMCPSQIARQAAGAVEVGTSAKALRETCNSLSSRRRRAVCVPRFLRDLFLADEARFLCPG